MVGRLFFCVCKGISPLYILLRFGVSTSVLSWTTRPSSWLELGPRNAKAPLWGLPFEPTHLCQQG